MRALILAFFALFVCATPSAAQQQPPIVMRDPAQYAQAFADQMTLAGVRPIRETFAALIAPAAVPADAEAALIAYERAITTLPAQVSRVVEDVELGGSLRIIYLYHYYSGSTWIFTRLEFVRIGEDWALTRIAFADRWANVVLATTPGFRSATPPAPNARR